MKIFGFKNSAKGKPSPKGKASGFDGSPVKGVFSAFGMIFDRTAKAIAWVCTSEQSHKLIGRAVYWWPVWVATAFAGVVFMELKPEPAGRNVAAPVITTPPPAAPVRPVDRPKPPENPPSAPSTPAPEKPKPAQPKPPAPKPAKPTVCKDCPVIYEQGFEPRSGSDDRMPVEMLSTEYGLDDPHLPAKLSGLGQIRYDKGRYYSACTASLVGRRDFVITAAHCLRGIPRRKWNDLRGKLKFFSVACNRWIKARRVVFKTYKSEENMPHDFGFIQLEEPACIVARPFQAMTLSDTAAKRMRDQRYPLLSLSVFPFDEMRNRDRYRRLRRSAMRRPDGLTSMGVMCRFHPRKDVTTHSAKSPMIYHTQQCDTFKGNSGAPLVVSLDGGKTYRVIAVLYGCSGGVDCWVRIKGTFAQDLERMYSQWGMV